MRPNGTRQLGEVHQTRSSLLSAKSRPFRVDIPEEAPVDLRNGLAAPRLPEQESVSDNSQGMRLATVQKLVRSATGTIERPRLYGASRIGARDSG
jgi:hypothetical protein